MEFKFKVKESRIALMEFLERNGYDVSPLNEATRTQQIVDMAEAQWISSNELKERHRFEVLKREIYGILDTFEFESLREAKPHDDAPRILNKLASEDMPMALVTNSGRRPVESVLNRFDFLKRLSVVVTRDEMNKMKPMPDGILLALKQMGFESKDVIYVGDSVIDIMAARSANMRCASVATGLYRREALERMAPDFFLHRLEDIHSIVFGRQE